MEPYIAVMIKYMTNRSGLWCLLLCLTLHAAAQPSISTNRRGGGYTFSLTKTIDCTPVKNQYKSGTCWAFSTNSFIASEAMRLGRGPVNLSEMYLVRNIYLQKAENYLRYQGHTNFGSGSEPHDVIRAMRQYGLMPYASYPGMPAGQVKPVHGEMDEVLKAMLDAMLKLHDGSLNRHWKAAFTGALDGYLGSPPATFEYEGKSYTPQSFAQWLGLDPDDYIELSSFTHHPFYTSFILEVPDNWANGQVYNLPLDELQKVVDNAIDNNYSVSWAADVSEKGFSFANGLAIVPEKSYENMTQAERDSMFARPGREMNVTQAVRQEAFDNLSTTDDHDMQIVGRATDQTGAPYYLVKNSWGMTNDLDGFLYCSLPYFSYKTTFIMINKHALPKDIAHKLGIKL
jgi:bleomycin hydrolase